MTEEELDQEAEVISALIVRLEKEAAGWVRPRGDELFRPFSIVQYRIPDVGERRQVCVSRQLREIDGYWRFEGGKYMFSRTPEGDIEYAALTENEAVAYTKAVCVPRVDLRRAGSAPEVISKPDGLIMTMADVETAEKVPVFVSAPALHGTLDGWKGPQDQWRAKEVLEQYRERIEQVANDKYVREGVLHELNGKPALLIQPSDL
jgi:hypothetical protein